jgi:hypothetical protein
VTSTSDPLPPRPSQNRTPCPTLPLSSQGHDLTPTKLTRPHYRAVYAGLILVHANNNSLHHVRISLGCVWAKIKRLGMSDMRQEPLIRSLTRSVGMNVARPFKAGTADEVTASRSDR